LDDKPRFRPIPKYEFVEYTTQSIPYEGTPLEVAPMLRNWEDSAWNNAKLDRAAFETTTYDPRPDDDQEKINEEQNWRDENITSKRALQGLDPGREFPSYSLSRRTLFELSCTFLLKVFIEMPLHSITSSTHFRSIERNSSEE